MPPRMRPPGPRAQLRRDHAWYRIENNAGTGTASVYLYDEIGYWGTSAAHFVDELSELTGVAAIDLHINSPGGEVFDGLAIMNTLRAHPATVTTYVDGIAASIASVIAMAGDRIVMGPHSQLMIHEGSGLCVGDAAEMRKMADLLDFQSDNIAGVYQGRAGGTVADWRALMVAETWYTAEEAVAAGLADEVAAPAQPTAPAADPAMANSWDLSVFRYAGRDEAPTPTASAATTVEVTPAEPAPVVDPPLDEQPPAAPAPDPTEVEPVDDAAAPAAAVDDWASLTAHLITPTSPATEADEFARLREALL